LIQSGQKALEDGYTALKDHLPFSPRENERVFRLIRESVGDDVALLHDAALVDYTYEEALHIGRVLEDLNFVWLEEPLPDRRFEDYIRLTERLDIPVAGAETLMNEPELSALWLKSGAVDILRVNGRHGTTAVLKLAHFAEMQHRSVEPNSLGPLFGLVHAHLCCGISNIRWFETAPPHNSAQLAEVIGLSNSVSTDKGWVTYSSDLPGWGAQWDWAQFEKNRIAIL
jgi:L-alanine-DL-glutamate epimerase-like enolase superfamily enzyme